MKTIILSVFKANCIALLREAQKTSEPIIVTRRGRPLARIEPLREPTLSARRPGPSSRRQAKTCACPRSRRWRSRASCQEGCWKSKAAAIAGCGPRWIRSRREASTSITVSPIEAYKLPGRFHKDPADRLLVATARINDLTLVSADERILAYRAVRTLDARR